MTPPLTAVGKKDAKQLYGLQQKPLAAIDAAPQKAFMSVSHTQSALLASALCISLGYFSIHPCVCRHSHVHASGQDSSVLVPPTALTFTSFQRSLSLSLPRPSSSNCRVWNQESILFHGVNYIRFPILNFYNNEVEFSFLFSFFETVSLCHSDWRKQHDLSSLQP